jgi:hypothetical protein
MWVFDAFRYVVRGLDDRAVFVPAILLIVAWLLWLRGPRSARSVRTLCVLGALVFGTIAVSAHIAAIAWWRVIHPWLHPHTAYCASSWWGDILTFFGTAGSFLLSLMGHGPGRAFALLAATLLVALRLSMW